MDIVFNKSREDIIKELDYMKEAYSNLFNETTNLKKENEGLKEKLSLQNRIWQSQENLINILLELTSNN
tara:strand:- start:112 stop:318 length:207 start_codon:yes stop_codon:yes gene_type:complete